MSGTTATELVAANPENVTPTAARRILTLGMLAALVYTVVTGAILIASWYAADHHFVYPLDDAYIGMAIAKNLALHGVWGVSRYGFTSADSSLLFPLLMAAVYQIAGVNEVAPLAISWLAAVASIFVAERMLPGSLSRAGRATALILFVILTPLFVAGGLGMEHSVHLLFTLIFLQAFQKARSGTRHWALRLWVWPPR